MVAFRSNRLDSSQPGPLRTAISPKGARLGPRVTGVRPIALDRCNRGEPVASRWRLPRV